MSRTFFPDHSFDAVFVHGVVEYLTKPVGAFKEMHRVLRPGSILCTRHGDWGGFLLAPADPLVQRFFSLFQQFMQYNGGDPYFGRNQIAALHQAGFTRMIASVSFDCWTTTPQARESVATFLAKYCVSRAFAEPLIQLNFADRVLLEQMSAALQAWGTNDIAFAAEAWGEAVAWKE